MPKAKFEEEIIQALKQRPRNGLDLQKDLHIPEDGMYNILKSMEEEGLIRWVSTQVNDGEWRIKNESH